MLHKINSNLDSAYYYTDYPFVRYGGKVEQGEDEQYDSSQLCVKE